jgi:hypothetical protein
MTSNRITILIWSLVGLSLVSDMRAISQETDPSLLVLEETSPITTSTAGAKIISMSGGPPNLVAPAQRPPAEEKPIECHPFFLPAAPIFNQAPVISFTISRDEHFAIAIGQAVESKTTIYYLDLQKDEIVSTIKIPKPSLKIIGASPSCNRIAMASDWSHNINGQSTIEMVDVQAGTAESWTIEGLGAKGFSGAVKRVHFIDEDRLISVGPTMIEWDFETAKAARKYHQDPGSPIAISNDGQYLACVSNNRAGIYDVVAGKCVGSMPVLTPFNASLVFSREGDRIALGSGDSTEVVSLMKGVKRNPKSGEDFLYFPGMEYVHWMTDRLMLVEPCWIYDLKLGSNIWNLQGDGPLTGPPSTLDGRNLWYGIASDGGFSLVRSPLPMQLIEELSNSFDPKSMQILPKTGNVAIGIDLPFNKEDVAQIRERIETFLKSIGLKVVPKADVMVVAKVEKGSKKQITLSENGTSIAFQERGDLFKTSITDAVEFTPTTSSLTILKNKNVVWSQLMENKLHSNLEVLKGETIQEAVTRASLPKKDFFMNTAIPRRNYSIEHGKLGRSILSVDGIR